MSFKLKFFQVENDVATLQLSPDETRVITLAIDFNESSSLGIELQFNRSQTVKLISPLGDIVNPVRFSTVEAFLSEKAKLTGMNEVTSPITIPNSKYKCTDSTLIDRLHEIVLSQVNVCTNKHLLTSPTTQLFYSACTLKFKSLILIMIDLDVDDNCDECNLKIKLTVNCEKMVLGSMLSKLIKDECAKNL